MIINIFILVLFIFLLIFSLFYLTNVLNLYFADCTIVWDHPEVLDSYFSNITLIFFSLLVLLILGLHIFVWKTYIPNKKGVTIFLYGLTGYFALLTCFVCLIITSLFFLYNEKCRGVSSDIFIIKDIVTIKKVLWSTQELSRVLDSFLIADQIDDKITKREFSYLVSSCSSPEQLSEKLSMLLFRKEKLWLLYLVIPYVEYVKDIAIYGNLAIFITRSFINVSSILANLIMPNFFEIPPTATPVVVGDSGLVTPVVSQISLRVQQMLDHDDLLGKFDILSRQVGHLQTTIETTAQDLSRLKKYLVLEDTESALMRRYWFTNNGLRSSLLEKRITLEEFNELSQGMYDETLIVFRKLFELRYSTGFPLHVYDIDSMSLHALSAQDASSIYLGGYKFNVT